jgi:hypothetical protein
MAKRISRQSQEQKLMAKWWLRIILALVFLGLAYGFASWAIDSGAWLAYGLGFFFIGWAFVQIKQSVHSLINR